MFEADVKGSPRVFIFLHQWDLDAWCQWRQVTPPIFGANVKGTFIDKHIIRLGSWMRIDMCDSHELIRETETKRILK